MASRSLLVRCLTAGRGAGARAWLCSAADGNGNGGAMESVRPVRLIEPPPRKVAMPLRDVAARLRESTSMRKGDQSVELTVLVSTQDKNKRRGNPRDPFRGLVELPHTYGTVKKIAVLSKDEDVAQDAMDAGAAVVGSSEIVQAIGTGKIQFDVLLVTPEMLPAIKKFGRQLGPKTPSVKRGTVGEDVVGMVRKHIAGRPYRMDKLGYVRMGVGKLSFDDEKLEENMRAIMASIESHRLNPMGRFILKAELSATQARESYPVKLDDFAESS